MPDKTEFRKIYGFDHDCECIEQMEMGIYLPITPCYTELCEQAMYRCKEALQEIRDERKANAQLRIQLKEVGIEPRV